MTTPPTPTLEDRLRWLEVRARAHELAEEGSDDEAFHLSEVEFQRTRIINVFAALRAEVDRLRAEAALASRAAHHHTKAMTSERLAEIRAIVQANAKVHAVFCDRPILSIHASRALLAEVDRLRAEAAEETADADRFRWLAERGGALDGGDLEEARASVDAFRSLLKTVSAPTASPLAARPQEAAHEPTNG